jgi:NAD(P)-dependent dehydrogenase (short-subunit alcohol dehydrogenase family)
VTRRLGASPAREYTVSERGSTVTDYSMSGKVAIVAGGGPLGRATAVTLAARGVSVVAVDRNEQALRELPDAVVREVADTTDPNTAKSVVDRIAAQVGPPGILVNTIGAFRPGDALSTTPEDLRLMVDVNLGTGLWLSQAVAPHMQRNGSGAIVHVSSRPGIEPSGGMAAYGVSKAALVHLTRILDVELRPHGIRVNGVAPQLLDTAKNRAQFPADTMAHATAPEAIADVIAFLVSDAAAPVSGAILPAYGA